MMVYGTMSTLPPTPLVRVWQSHPSNWLLPSAAAANDGKIMAPHILKAMVSNGRQYNTTPQVIANPIKPETARTLTEMLATSLEEESSDALVDGYRLAGKTGTAEIPTPYGYSMGVTNASFVGWGPVDDPKFLVYVWLEKPKTSIWGSIVAAPVFRGSCPGTGRINEYSSG